MKKQNRILLGIIIGAVVVLGLLSLIKPAPTKGAKDITLTFVDEVNGGEVLDEILFNTDLETLEEVLLALDYHIDLEMEEGPYGAFINGLYGLETKNMDKGPWWLYESDTNQLCLDAGFCPGVSELMINDGDKFTFIWDASY